MNNDTNNNNGNATFTTSKGNTYNLNHLMIGGADVVQANRADQPTGNHDNRPASAISGFGAGHPSMEYSGGQVHQMGVETFKGSELRSAFGGDILSTARGPSGAHISDMSKITGDTLVEYKGTTLQVKTAIQLGLLAKDIHGNIIDPSAELRSSAGGNGGNITQSQSQPQKEVVKVDLAGDSRDNINAIYRQMGVGLADSTVASIIGAAFRGDDHRQAVLFEDVAQSMGITPNAAKSVVQKAFDDVTNKAMHFGENRLGLPMGAIADHLDKCSTQFKVDCYLRMFHNDLTVFDELNKAYRSGNKY